MIESGVAGFEAGIWTGVFGPARLPQALADKLYRDVTEIVKSPGMQSAMLVHGAEAVTNTPQELSAFVKTEIVKWARVIKEAGIKPE